MRGLFTLVFSCMIASVATGQTAMPAETRNAALRYWLAYAEMHDPPDKSTSDLLEKTAAGDLPWDEAKLGPLVDGNVAAIETLQRASRLPDCDWGLEYSEGPAASIAPVVKGRVLGRLNAAYGIRLAAKGDTQGAVDAWVANIRFSQHLAKGGSLIFSLIATNVLQSSLHALTQAAQSGSLNERQKRQIESAVRAIPETGFDWGEAMYFEEVATAVFLRQLSEAPVPRIYFQEATGKAARADFSVPAAADVAQFHKTMAAGETILELPPEETGAKLPAIETEIKGLQPIVRETIPSYERVNDVRLKVRAQRQQLLDALAAQNDSRH